VILFGRSGKKNPLNHESGHRAQAGRNHRGIGLGEGTVNLPLLGGLAIAVSG